MSNLDELREKLNNIRSDAFSYTKGESETSDQVEIWSFDTEKLIEFIFQETLRERIDENENWARHIGAAWDNEVVNHEDVHKRLEELKAQLTANKSKNK